MGPVGGLKKSQTTLPWEDGSSWDPCDLEQLRVDGGMCQQWREDDRDEDIGGNGCTLSAREEDDRNNL